MLSCDGYLARTSPTQWASSLVTAADTSEASGHCELDPKTYTEGYAATSRRSRSGVMNPRRDKIVRPTMQIGCSGGDVARYSLKPEHEKGQRVLVGLDNHASAFMLEHTSTRLSYCLLTNPPLTQPFPPQPHNANTPPTTSSPQYNSSDPTSH